MDCVTFWHDVSEAWFSMKYQDTICEYWLINAVKKDSVDSLMLARKQFTGHVHLLLEISKKLKEIKFD